MSETPSWMSLDNDEKLLYIGHPSMYTLIPGLITGLIVVVVTTLAYQSGDLSVLGRLKSYLDAFMWITVPATFLPPLAGEIRRRYTVYAVTTDGVYYKKWVIGRSPQYVPVKNIQKVDWEQKPLQRLAGVGDVDIHSAANSDDNMKWRMLPNPNETVKSIKSVMSD